MMRRAVAYRSARGAIQRIRRATKGAVSIDIGISLDHYADYLESLFRPGMTWFNHGVANIHTREAWQIDHIKPVGVKGLSEEEYHARGHYTNTRPIWHDDHAAKTNIDRADMRLHAAAIPP